MKIFNKIEDCTAYLQSAKDNGNKLGFVPTMGALHEGHLELILQSKEENDITICSIFVNPIQFNNPEDLKKYPRTMDTDIEKLESIQCDVLFAPEVGEMYPDKVTKNYDFGQLDKVMEGEFRPGHFNGVAVVVKLLFDIVIPHKAYFGLKDYQQLAIVRKMVEIEELGVEIVPCPIVREDDGLAMSSRNRRLTLSEREVASAIYQNLKMLRSDIGQLKIDDLKTRAIDNINMIEGFEVEYLEVVDAYTLMPVKEAKEDQKLVASVAAFLGNVRLIDNMALN